MSSEIIAYAAPLRQAVSKGPLKLAALLEDVADQPNAPATSRVSLDVLQDAKLPPEKHIWYKHLPKGVAAIAVAILLGGAYAVVTNLKGASVVGPAPQARNQEVIAAKPIEAPAPSVDRTAFSEPVQELMRYADDLRQGKITFEPRITGEEAAKQLGYTRLFASVYEEMILRLKAREPSQGPLRLNDVVAGLDEIVREEQAIDHLLTRRERHAAAIAYLRALQNGDVVFPGPQPLAPAPPVVLSGLMSAYPEVSFDVADPIFAALYRRARDYAAVRVKNAGEVWAQEIIAELRRIILQSSASVEKGQISDCQQAWAIGEMATLTKFCPRLVLSRGMRIAVANVLQNPRAIACQTKAADELHVRLRSVNYNIDDLCKVIEERVRSGKLSAFEVTN